MTSALDARYGRTPQRRRRALILAIVVGAAVLVTAIVWVIWVGLFTPSAAVQAEDVGSVTVDDSTVRVTSQISADPDTAITCSVQGLDEDFAVVGWKIIHLPPSDQRIQRIVTTLRTTEPAVNGLIGSCWVT